ncbi:ABC transporter permease [Liquorilactobacillus satsumensis]|nr:ABC transporter permease [Liquorilactobacillus satsumensis]MCP9312428.1 ABC transporter permease [Liquorilactobacillus satsumensis]MCP9329014.1 ABC transporter permease [Liquorilactobacillus satsumensis]
MSLRKRVFLNVKINKGRSVGLFLVLSMILLFILVGLILEQTAKEAIQRVKSSANATVTLTANREQAFRNITKPKGTQQQLTLPAVRIAVAKKIAAATAVKSYNVSSMTTVKAVSFSAVTETADASATHVSGRKQNTENLSLLGVTRTTSLIAFSSGGSKITQGRALRASDGRTRNIIIEEQLAKKNKLKVGSKISIKSSSQKNISLKVVGIYQGGAPASSLALGQMNTSNTIYAGVETVNQLKNTNGMADSVTFSLKNAVVAKKFVKMASLQLDSSQYVLAADDSVYRALLTPLNNVRTFAKGLLLVSVSLGTIILTIIVAAIMSKRRAEIGILLSLGEKRMKIAAQVGSELLLIGLVASVMAVSGGTTLGNLISKQLIQQNSANASSLTIGTAQNQQAENNATTEEVSAQTGTQQGILRQNQQLKTLTVHLSWNTYGKLIVLGSLIIVLAVLIGTAHILFLEPYRFMSR